MPINIHIGATIHATRLIWTSQIARITWQMIARIGNSGNSGIRNPYVSSSAIERRILITHTFTIKNKNRNIMLALEATSAVGSIVVTTNTIPLVAISAP